jgi:simple sugar transport system permease protein
MNSFWDLFSSVNFYVTIISLATPLIFASMAALISNKAGVVNISIEGTMLVSALVGAIFSSLFNSAILGIIFACFAGVFLGYIFALATIKLRTNEILVGIALNILAAGLVVFIIYALTGNKSDYSSVALKPISIPLLRDIPIIGEIFFDSLNLLVYVAVLVVIGMTFFLKKTVLGVRIRSVGINASAVDSIGVSSERVKVIALLIAGGLAGLGGAYMSIGFMSSFNTGMIAGRGFIGLAAEAIGAGIPYVTALFAVVFGLVNAFSLTAQTITGINIPYELLNTLPYIVTIIGLVVFAVIKKKKTRE